MLLKRSVSGLVGNARAIGVETFLRLNAPGRRASDRRKTQRMQFVTAPVGNHEGLCIDKCHRSDGAYRASGRVAGERGKY